MKSCLLLTLFGGTLAALPLTMNSPNQDLIEVRFDLSATGRPTYSMSYKGAKVILESGMGLELFDDDKEPESFYDNFELIPENAGDFDFEAPVSEMVYVNEPWEPLWGEEDLIENEYHDYTVRLVQRDDRRRRLNIRFKVYDIGVGFRYEIPAQPNLIHYDVKEEQTEFAMTGDHFAWWLPGDYDTQEWNYQASRLSYIRYLFDDALEPNVCFTSFSKTGVQTALQMKTDEGIYLNIHEAALVNYSCMHLELDDSRMVFQSHLTPDAVGVKAHLQSPNVSPWRTIMATDDAREILASRITYNLNEERDMSKDWSWVQPIKYMGVWWEMIVGHRSWDYTEDVYSVHLGQTDYEAVTPHGRHGATNQNVMDYIDFASEHGFDELLVEGWNVGWEDWFGLNKDYVFDFLTTYPDFNIDLLNNYANEKGIRLMMHHETSGSTRNYERHLHRAYQLMEDYGYKSVKSGYVGGLLPHGQHHYSQDIVNHYLYCIQEAFKYKISVNAHEAVRPTGLARTYPNMLAHESARGQEYMAFDNGNHPHHVTILPFTRQIGGPMDYTPGVMNMNLNDWVDGGSTGKLNSTIANQLGLFVTMYSPLQMAADTYYNYEPHVGRGFNFIKDVPVEWKKSVYIDAEPGSHVTIARLDKHSPNWFVGNVNGIYPRYQSFKFDFLEESAVYKGYVYYDAPRAHYWDNPHAYDIREIVVTKDSEFNQWTAAGGGFAISLFRDDTRSQETPEL